MRLQEEAEQLRKRTAGAAPLSKGRQHTLHEKAKLHQERRKEAFDERQAEIEVEQSGADLPFSPRITKMAKSIGGSADFAYRESFSRPS